jgi:hypothetical protein
MSRPAHPFALKRVRPRRRQWLRLPLVTNPNGSDRLMITCASQLRVRRSPRPQTEAGSPVGQTLLSIPLPVPLVKSLRSEMFAGWCGARGTWGLPPGSSPSPLSSPVGSRFGHADPFIARAQFLRRVSRACPRAASPLRHRSPRCLRSRGPAAAPSPSPPPGLGLRPATRGSLAPASFASLRFATGFARPRQPSDQARPEAWCLSRTPPDRAGSRLLPPGSPLPAPRPGPGISLPAAAN